MSRRRRTHRDRRPDAVLAAATRVEFTHRDVNPENVPEYVDDERAAWVAVWRAP